MTRNFSSTRLGAGILLGLSILALVGPSPANAEPKPTRERRVTRTRVVTRPAAVRYVPRAHMIERRALAARATCGASVPARPWWHGARRVTYGCAVYRVHPRLGVAFGAAALGLPLGELAPHGYLYLDPVSGHTFRRLGAYRCFAAAHPHRPLLATVVKIDRR